MTDTQQRKRDRISKKVIPHLQKSLSYWQAEELEKSENELILAISIYKKEKTRITEIMHHFASLYNNLGAKQLLKKNWKKAFNLLSKSLAIKIEYFPSDISSVEGTFRQLVTAGLLSCQFNELHNLIKIILGKYPNEDRLKAYLTQCSKLAESVQNNEPQVLIAGMQITFPLSTRRIDDLVHFPKAFEDVEMNFKSELMLTDHATLECSFLMTQKDSKAMIPIPYEIDSWKKMRPKELESKINNNTPNLIIFLSESEHIPANTVKVTDKEGNVVNFEFRIAFSEFYIPDSYPRFGFNFGQPLEIPACKSFKYFRGKAGILEWEMKSGEEYQISLNVKNYQSISPTDTQSRMRIGILTPFKRITYNTINFKHTNKVTIDTIQQKSIRYFNDRDRPASFSFLPEPDSISEKQFNNASSASMDSDKQLFNLLAESSKEFDEYSVFGILFYFRIASGNLSIATSEWEQPVPTALSHLLMDRNFSFPPLCQYDIINNSRNEVTLTIKTKIGDFTDDLEETKTILPYSTVKVSHTPLFKYASIKLRETCEANLDMHVLVGNQTVLKRSVRTSLLAFDTMIFEILNPLTREVFNLHDFIVVWVTPHDQEVENVLPIAKEYHPKRTLQGYPSGLSDEQITQSINLECEAIFMALKEIGISYIDSSISFGWLKPYAFQRVKLPATTIKTKAANCIDGTILFASLLEHIGIQPIIVLVPGHALVGWKPIPNSTKIVLLETTLISSATFEKAIECGRMSLNEGLEDAKKILQNPNLTLEKAVQSGLIKFIDVTSMREKNIFPSTM